MNVFVLVRPSEVPIMPDLQILAAQPSRRVDEDARMNHLLDSAMFDPKRRVKYNFISIMYNENNQV
jgi:hypothetical protein